MITDLFSATPSRALGIFAHPDDADVACGGTLATWSSAGAKVHLVVVALGDKGSTVPVNDVDELVARRHAELDAGAACLGLCSVEQLNRRDGEFENDASLRAELVEVIRRVRPEVVICPDPTAVFFGEHYYNHRDHRVTGWAALDAVAPAAGSPLYFPSTGPAWQVTDLFLSGSLEPTVAVDVTSGIDTKLEAVLAHKSQLDDADALYRSVVRERAEQEGRRVGVGFAESFRRISLSA